MRVWFVPIKAGITWFLLCFLIGIFLALQNIPSAPVSGDLSNRISGKLIIIDPGHGGVDPGAVGPADLFEKDVVLAIAKQLQVLLNQAAIFTILVRDTDVDLADPDLQGLSARKKQDLTRRVDLCNQVEADLIISIHANFFPQSQYSGAQTFYNPKSEDSIQFARIIQEELIRNLGPNNRQARPGDFQILRDTNSVGALVEVGFLSNPAEAALLADPHYQTKVASALFLGILRYLVRGEITKEAQ